MKNRKMRVASVLLAAVLALGLTACSKAEPEPEESADEESTETSESAVFPSAPESSAQSASEISDASESESASQMSATSEPAEAIQNPFALDPSGRYNLYAYDPANYIYADLGWAYWSSETLETDPLNTTINAINSLPLLSPGEAPTGPVEAGFLSVATEDYSKVEYLIYPGVLQVNGTNYALPDASYQNLKSIAQSATANGGSAQWFVYMNPDRVVSIECQDVDGEMKQVRADNIGLCAVEPIYMSFTDGKAYTPGTQSFDGMFKAVYTFDNGVTYTIAAQENKLWVEASGMGYACAYNSQGLSIASYIQSVQSMIDGPANPRTGKPVIYLYPTQKQDVQVQLDFKGRLGYTFPTYGDGWEVTAQPDGTLTNKSDGSTHYYLFWDGDADRRDWDFSEGFVVAGDEVEEFFKQVLPKLGLLPREYNDFITYWTPELRVNPYNLITFSTTEYEQTAPLTISPKPDTLLRVHMVYQSLDEKIEVPKQTLPPAPKRSGFTVVEWGGTRA